MEKSFCVLVVIQIQFSCLCDGKGICGIGNIWKENLKMETIKGTRKDNGQGLRDKSIKKDVLEVFWHIPLRSLWNHLQRYYMLGHRASLNKDSDIEIMFYILLSTMEQN